MAITSTFDTGADGWSIEGDVASSGWQSTGGNPGGYFGWVDAATGADSYFVAGSQFLGNQSSYYGGTFSYSIEDSGNGYSGVPDIELTGDGITLVRVVGQPADGAQWTTYSVSLTAAGWHVGSLDGAEATPEQMQDVLGDLTQILVRAEYVNGGETGGIDNVSLACYCRGTMIATAAGEVAVEHLSIGDHVITRGGALRPIKWIGTRSYSGRFVAGEPDTLPVCIKAHAFADTVPARDLWVSPHHALFVDGFLIEAKDLVNGSTISQAERVARVDYFHVELESHDLILADGAWAESFLDDNSRGIFQNAQAYRALYPTDGPQEVRYCAPRIDEGAALEAVRTRLAARAHDLDIATLLLTMVA